MSNNVVLNMKQTRDAGQIYRSQGILGKFFDRAYHVTGLGLSKDTVDIDKKLDKYYDQQKNSTEIAIDLMTGVSAAGAFRFAKKLQAYSHLYVKNKKFETISTLIGLGISAFAGMVTKPVLKGINALGTPRKERRKESTVFRDIGSGFVDGAAAPLAYAYKLGIIGAAGINSASRYVFNKKADKDSNFADHLSNSWLVKAPALALGAFSAFKFHKRIDVVEKAIVKAKDNVKNIEKFKGKMPLSELADLAKSNLKDKQTQSDLIQATKRGFFSKTYMTLTWPIRKLFGGKPNPATEALELVPKPLKRITFMNKELIKEKEMNNIMREIEQYNIFYPKMIQSMPSNISSMINIVGDGKNPLEELIQKTSKESKMGGFWKKRSAYIAEKGINTVNDFLNKYKSSCPPSRTVKEAQKYVSETYGKRFTLKGDKPLGVGTIAETFLAKDNETGNDVVIKMVKKWVSLDKLKKDKENMLKSLERVKDKIKPDEYDYQRKLVDELYSAWSKEVDLKLEAEAAKTLGKYAVNYNTVSPVAVKNNIFVMEKANGVQFDKLEEYLKKNKINLTEQEAEDIYINYMKVFFEQLHADPHAGNIFVDLKNKSKPFTFIDTGNVMRYTPEGAIQNVTSHIDYLIGNSKAISKRLLKDAVLPEGMSQKQAEEMLTKHLDETFFSGKNRICGDPFSTINNACSEFMSKNKVIINSSNTNLLKAELTYFVNMTTIGDVLEKIDKEKLADNKQMKLLGKQIQESVLNGMMNNKKCTWNEVYSRYKYINDNPEQFFTTLYSFIPPN